MFSALICAPYQAPVFLIFFVKNSCHLEWFFPLNFHSWTYMANPNFATTEQVHFANGEHDLLSTVINQCVASARDGDDYNSDSPEASVSVADDSIDPITEAREQLMAANPPLTAIGESFVGPVSTLSENEEGFAKNHDRDGANFQLAIYIAMAHAGLVLATAICYGVCLLLKDYWTPIHWAILISMPLHRIQAAAFEFWKRPLQLGLAQAFFAIPAAMLFALLDTVEDIRETFRAISIRDFAPISDDAKFYKLFQWLFFLWTCLLCYEYVGLVYMIAVACVAGATYRMLHVVYSIVTAKYTNWVPQAHEHRGSAAQLLFFTVHASRWSNRGLAQTLIKNLSFLVALQLIVSMTLVILGGTILFSFKVSVETKDAVDALKSNLEAGKRFSDWLGTSPTSLNIDKYMMMAYDTVVQRVNDYAEESNMTTVAHAAKEFLDVIAYNGGGNPATDDKSSFWEKFMTITHVFAEKFGGGSMSGSYSILVGLGTDVANFVKQVLVFVAMLFFLITSENGGVMEQVLHMIPLSELTRHKCASVLDRTISAVLVTTGKLMLFQALFTYLLFRFLKIHFLYVSTSIALVNGLMPVFPNWMASLPALLQLLIEKKILWGVSTAIIYKYVMDYGVTEIQGVVSNHNQYLTGLSIAGGMTLFQPAIKGVIMGPLVMTVLVALRDLYSEFVLKVVTAYQGSETQVRDH